MLVSKTLTIQHQEDLRMSTTEGKEVRLNYSQNYSGSLCLLFFSLASWKDNLINNDMDNAQLGGDTLNLCANADSEFLLIPRHR